MPHSNNPIDAYAPSTVPEPEPDELAASAIKLIRDGKLYLSLQDAIELALENNLDLAIARYNLPIADTDILRTKAGGSSAASIPAWCRERPAAASAASARALRAQAPAAPRAARAARARAHQAWCNRPWAPEPRYRPTIRSSAATSGIEHQTTPLSNLQIYGVPALQLNTGQVNVNYSQAFPTGTSFSFESTTIARPPTVFTTA